MNNISKWTVAILLTTCMTFPAMGYEAAKATKTAKTDNHYVAPCDNTRVCSPAVKQDKKVKKAKKTKKHYKGKASKKEQKNKSGCNANTPKLVWECHKSSLTPELANDSKEQIEKLQQVIERKKKAAEQPADFCEKNCEPKFGPDVYEAEMELQKIRDTYDPTASFEKYPWLLYNHSDKCEYSKKQPIPNNTKNTPRPDED